VISTPSSAAARETAIQSSKARSAISSGSSLFARAPSGVVQQWYEDSAADPRLVCQVGGVTFDPRRHEIDCDSDLDIATFGVSPVVIAGARAEHHSATTWPPARVQPGEVLVLGGWLGSHREEGIGETTHAFASFITRADDSSRSIAIALNLATATPTGRDRLKPGSSLGGASGGPVFRYVSAPIERLELAGFIFECMQAEEIILARHAASVAADGTINR